MMKSNKHVSSAGVAVVLCLNFLTDLISAFGQRKTWRSVLILKNLGSLRPWSIWTGKELFLFIHFLNLSPLQDNTSTNRGSKWNTCPFCLCSTDTTENTELWLHSWMSAEKIDLNTTGWCKKWIYHFKVN